MSHPKSFNVTDPARRTVEHCIFPFSRSETTVGKSHISITHQKLFGIIKSYEMNVVPRNKEHVQVRMANSPTHRETIEGGEKYISSIEHPNQMSYQDIYPSYSQSLRSIERGNVYPHRNSNIHPLLVKGSQSSRSWKANNHQKIAMDSVGRSQSARNNAYYEGRDELEHIREDTDTFHPFPSRHVSVRGGLNDNLIRNERDDYLEMRELVTYPRSIYHHALRDGVISRTPSRYITRGVNRGASTFSRRRAPTTSQSISTDDEYSARSDRFEVHPIEFLNRVLDYAVIIFNAAILAVCPPHFDEGDSESRKYSFD
jgi:hypothetical protein